MTKKKEEKKHARTFSHLDAACSSPQRVHEHGGEGQGHGQGAGDAAGTHAGDHCESVGWWLVVMNDRFVVSGIYGI